MFYRDLWKQTKHGLIYKKKNNEILIEFLTILLAVYFFASLICWDQYDIAFSVKCEQKSRF